MITKQITMPNGAMTGIHRVSRIEASDPFLTAAVTVLSYPTEAAYLAGANPIWSTPLVMPVDPSVSIAGVESWLISSESIFQGGSIIPDTSTSLDNAKTRKWAQIKQARSQAEYAGFTWSGSTFDSDATSQNRITGAVTLATLSPAFSIGWILADNTVRTLSATDMMQVGEALGQHVATQFSHGASLRAQIESAATQAEVEAVVW